MRRRAHAALWIAGIVATLLVEPLVCTAPQLMAFAACTEALLAGGEPHVTAAIALAKDLTAGWDGEHEIGGVTRSPSRAHRPHIDDSRWKAVWRLAILRLALAAGAGASCWPILMAGLVDGLAMRRAMRGRLDAASPRAAAAAGHVLVAVFFVPLMWATLPLGAVNLALPAWSLGCAAALSFALSRTGGIVAT